MKMQSTNNTEKQVVLITGCSSGFGYLTALLFAHKGWIVYGTLRNLESSVAKELSAQDVRIIRLDINNEEEIVQVVSLIKKDVGKIDVLINNAGVGFLGPVEEFTSSELRKQFEVNFFGVHSLIREVLPLMRAQKSGKIINVSSLAARSTTALYGVYSATKAALEAMSEALNLEVSRWNISVTLVEPGSFATKFGANMTIIEATESPSPYEKLREYNTRVREKLDGKQKIIDILRNPQRVALLLYKIALMAHPKLRYPIGLDAFGVLLSTKLFSYEVRKYLLKRVYRW